MCLFLDGDTQCFRWLRAPHPTVPDDLLFMAWETSSYLLSSRVYFFLFPREQDVLTQPFTLCGPVLMQPQNEQTKACKLFSLFVLLVLTKSFPWWLEISHREHSVICHHITIIAICFAKRRCANTCNSQVSQRSIFPASLICCDVNGAVRWDFLENRSTQL